MGSLGSTLKARVTSKKTLPKSKFSSDPVRATAVAAGARNATPLDAALLKAAQAKNPIHIIPPKGGSSNKSLPPGGLSVKSEPHPNVHHIRPLLSPSSYPPTAVTASARLVSKLQRLTKRSMGLTVATTLNYKVDSKQKAVSESSLTNAQNSAGSLNTEKYGSNDKAVIGVQAEEKPSAKDEIISCSQVSVGGGDNPSAFCR
ncbi:hypothetical protein M0R45_027290 [Rubus argutus]|uniref:Uncharacterized protein n=1 Tax=Rubus argutus TaxID=59490 RepID=A0AAW1WZY6_RUBAR